MTDTKKHLTHLESVGLIQLAKTHPELEFMFRHALIRDAAYKSLLREDRIKLHQQVAEAIERTYPDQLDEYAASLAQHYTAAGLTEQAIPYWQRAGDYARRRSANVEAISHFNQGLELLETLPDTPELAQQELALQIGVGPALIATRGYGAPEVERTFSRARQLCEQIGETSQLFPVLYGLATYYFVRAELQTTREIRERMLRLAERQKDPALLLVAHRALGFALLFLGELVPARSHLEQVLRLYDPKQHHHLAFRYVQDPRAAGLLDLSWDLWYLGYPDQALQRSQEALIWAQELSHPHTLAYTLNFASVLHNLRREVRTTQNQAEAVISLSTKHGFRFWLAYGTIMRGGARAEQGELEEGIAQIRQGRAALRATGAEQGQPYNLALLAEALGKAGQIEEGLATLTEALALVEKSGEHLWEAELHRLRGELLLMQGADEGEVEQNFQKAIEIARAQQAKSLELRATVSLSRLWHSQGSAEKQAEARQMLVEIYGWFTEGFDTLDLQEAKALLEELG